MLKTNYILFFLLIWFQNYAQKTYRVELINYENGLPSDFVYTTLKKDNKLYIATKRGLSLYDGYQFVTSKKIQTQTKYLVKDKDQLFFNYHGKGGGIGRIKNIFDTPVNIATIDYGDQDTNNDHYENIYVDAEKRVWCSDQNNIKYFLETKKIQKSYPIDIENKDVEFNVSFLEPSDKKKIWAFTHKGLFLWDKKTEKVIRPRNNTLINTNFESAVLYSKDSIIYSTKDAVYLYKISENNISLLYNTLEKNTTINIGKKIFKDTNEIFFYTKQQLCIFDIKNKKKTKLFESINKINDVYFDEETKIIWVSTDKGLYKLIENDERIITLNPPFALPNTITSIVEDADQTLWMTLKTNYLLSYSKKGVWKKHEVADQSSELGYLSTHQNGVIISSLNGVYENKNGKITKILNTTYEVRKAILDSKKLLWVVAEKGKVRVYKNGIEIPNYIKATEDFWKKNIVTDIGEDKYGRIWFSGWMPKTYGIAFFDENKKEIYEISRLKSYQNMRYLISDYYNRLSFSKYNDNIIFSGHGGFNTVTKSGMITHALNTLEYNVVNDEIEGITDDKDGNIWFASAEGLNVYLFKTNTVISYTQIDGFESNDLKYGFCKLSNNSIAIGVDRKIQIANPEKLLKNNLFSSLELIAIKKDGMLIPNTNNNFVFDYDFIELDLHFSSLSYSNYEKISYRYKFEGDKKWTLLGSNPKLPLVKLQPGKYKLIIQVGDNFNNWSKNKLTINIEVNPPFYQTFWFYLLILIFLFGVVYFINRHLVLEEKRVGKLNKKIKEGEMQTLRAQMNPHFIFNSLNSINSFVIQEKTKEASGYLTTFSKLMRFILENSRQSEISLYKEMESLKLYLELESARLDHKFDYEFEYDDELDIHGINVPPLIIQPFTENSIWHGLHNKKGKGKLTIKFEEVEETKLIIRIIDNGIGREAASLLKQKETHHKSYGIDITLNRLLLLNSENKFRIIDLYDSNGDPKGTEVQLEINYDYD